MTNLGQEKRPAIENHEVFENRAVPGTSSRNSSTDSGKKLRFGKLWVCTKKSNPSSPKAGKSSSKKSQPSNVLLDLEAIEKNRNDSAVTEQKSSQTFFDCNSTIDASTETRGRDTADVEISCRCKTVCAASGPDTFIEIRCVNSSRSLAVQTDARTESKRDKWRGRSIREETSSSSSRSEELLEASENIYDDLIYDGMKRCFPYPIELTGKPKYVATCESCESPTDKWVSIAHGGLDAAVGSSIIIDVPLDKANGTRDFHDGSYQKSVSCEVCSYCKELARKTRSRVRVSDDEGESRRSSRDECGACLNRRRNRERKKRTVSSREKSTRSSDFTDDDFTDLRRSAEYHNCGGSREKSNREHGHSSSDERRSERSRTDNKEHSVANDSSMFRNDSASSWLDDREYRESTRLPLHESSRLSLGSIENSGRTLHSLGYREIDPSGETKLFGTSTETKKSHGLAEREINVRAEDFDEVVLRKRKPRTGETSKIREREAAVTKRWQILDKNAQFLGYKRDEPFTFAMEKFTKPAPGINEFRQLLAGTCKISEFNNFGKRYDWDRPTHAIIRQKTCKCGNGCGGLNSRNKCCCNE